MKSKKILYIISIVIFSLIVSISNYNSFLVDSTQLIPSLLELLALCLTAYTFIYSPLSNFMKKNINIENELKELLNEFEKNILFIFLAAVLIIVFDIIKSINIPFINNPVNIDFGLFQINSLKSTVFKFLFSFLSSLSILALYDLIKGTFIILRISFEQKSKN